MAIYVSKYKNLRLVIKPANKTVVNGRIFSDMGKDIIFKDGRYETKKIDEISFLEKHHAKGVDFFKFEEEEIKVVIQPKNVAKVKK